ncbi:MAG: type IV pilus modification PilV family protein [Alphaproteobacteria bacterium]
MKNAARGFTLLEVVVAMAIVGLGVVTLLELFSMGLRLGARSAARTEANSYARQVMDEVLARRTLENGTERGRADANRRWTLQIQSVPQSDQTLTLSNDWELKEISLDVVVMDAGSERHVELRTLRLVKKTKS